ncbi:hypothetical protein [uncultured Polaribacter sp.]|uniref:hypothetical protein n=1 Tax=uncultured Polaribacter sp. TaxID=174711 RepID=UPI002628D616|nr:hypothetical protein [uncultured Polaribacter sp.]
MIKKITILFSLVFIISCSNNDNTDTFDISGEFTHTISDCDNTNNNNNEINCVEFIEFNDETTATILIDGNDIIEIVNYEINNDQIDVNRSNGINICSFLIQNDTTLKRTGSDDIWIKK